METNKKGYPFATLNGMKSKINTNPDYQRPPVWNTGQKQLLMDTIMRGYDIPKIYLKPAEKDSGYKFEVIDGQQRLRTIWEFCDDKFALANNMDPVDGVECASMKYSDLDMDLRSELDSYSVDAVIVKDALQNEEEDEIKEMFLRLQNGTSLKAQEKRNAMPGKMRDFVRDISAHVFFKNCKFSNARYAFDHVAAQMICIEMAGSPTNVKNGDLNRMYEKHKDFDSNGRVAKRVKNVLDYLLRAFPEKTPELERYNVISLYCIASDLIEAYVYSGTEEKLAEWFIQFETNRRADDKLDEDKKDARLVEYKALTSSATDSEERIRSRVEFLQARFFSSVADILQNDNLQKDETRSFSQAQRLAIYRKDGARCQLKIKCDGTEKLPWNNWHADHINPHSKGGKTIVSNGQVACPDCNLAKGNNES